MVLHTGRIFALVTLFILTGCKPAQDDRISGYVEGEYVYVSPSTGGILQTLSVERGQQIKEGDALFSLDITQLEAELNAAAADLKQAEARMADLTKGQRPEEINIIAKRKEEADAALRNASRQYERSRTLAKENYATQSRVDADRAAFESAQARVASITAELEAANLGGRDDAIMAAQAVVDAARQRVAQAGKRLHEINPNSPLTGRVEDTYFRPGEFVPAGTPVVSLLPPGNVKIRFFVPQARLAALSLGKPVSINCDGCSSPVPGKISYISSQSEFTPPVIYSVGSRDKLVFMIEAKPDSAAAELHPGLPVDISVQP